MLMEDKTPCSDSRPAARKIVLTSSIREVKAHFEALGSRLSEKELLELANAPAPAGVWWSLLTGQSAVPGFIKNAVFSLKKLKFFTDEAPCF